MKTPILAAALTVALFAAQDARAEERVNTKRPINPDGTVTVRNVAGSVKIIGGDAAEVVITGTLGRGVKRLDISGEADRTDIHVELDRNSGHGEADLQIQLPKRCRVEVKTVSANIDARGLENNLQLETVSGDIRLEAKLKELDARTVSGDLNARGIAERTDLRTVSGDVELRDGGGEIEVESVSGDVRITGELFTRARVKTVSGEIEVTGKLDPNGRSFDFESHSGDVELALPDNTVAEIEMRSFSGQLESELGNYTAKMGRREGFGNGSNVRFTIGGDASKGARVSIRTFSGDARIRKR